MKQQLIILLELMVISVCIGVLITPNNPTYEEEYINANIEIESLHNDLTELNNITYDKSIKIELMEETISKLEYENNELKNTVKELSKKVTITKQKSIDTDFKLLADLVMAESENQNSNAQYLVACVVLNRVKSDLFPNNIRDVIFQQGQFSCTTDGRINKVKGNPSEDVTKATKSALESNTLQSNILYFTSNGYLKGTVPHNKVGDMYFSKQK